MATSVQLNLPPVQVHPPVPLGTKAGPAAEALGTTGLSLLVEGASDTACSDKEIAYALGLPDASYWSKVKSKEKPAPRIDRLTDLPPSVQRAMCRRWAITLRLRVSEEDAKAAAALDLAAAAIRFMQESA